MYNVFGPHKVDVSPQPNADQTTDNYKADVRAFSRAAVRVPLYSYMRGRKVNMCIGANSEELLRIPVVILVYEYEFNLTFSFRLARSSPSANAQLNSIIPSCCM